MEQHRRHLVDLAQLRRIVGIPERQEAESLGAPRRDVLCRLGECGGVVVEQAGRMVLVPERLCALPSRDLAGDVGPGQLPGAGTEQRDQSRALVVDHMFDSS
jgi:hypothetical protein